MPRLLSIMPLLVYLAGLTPTSVAKPSPILPVSADEYCATAEQQSWLASLTNYDIFTNAGNYVPRVECMQTASGSPDWFWITALIVLTLGVIAWYAKIFFFWRQCYLAEAKHDRNNKMMQLAQIFLWCGICGYGMSVLMFFWPAYRLLAIFLLVLNIWSWRFVSTLGDFRISLSAKRLERELRESLESRAAELENLVSTRTAELQRARTEAEQANASKSMFLANMSHEIRTPMTAILGFTDLIDSADLSETERAESLATVKRNGHHLLQVINDILDLSKIESGEMTVESISCSPRVIVADAYDLYRERADAKGIILNTKINDSVPDRIISDPTRLRQILFNIASNALKFTESGSISIEASADEQWVEFAVIDSGVGMSQDQLERIFSPFVQADESTTRRYGGTGLGLSIAKALAKKLGGTIDAASTIGNGSVFTLRIPRQATLQATNDTNGSEQAKSPASVATARKNSLHGRILLVEDGPDNQRLIAHVLKRAGLTVDLADNGRIGADKVIAATEAQTPYDLVLMDMQMPEMDGYTATRLLRDRGCTIPIVALTANAMASDRDKCIAAGCTEYASKPLNVPVLLNLLSRLLDTGASRRDAA